MPDGQTDVQTIAIIAAILHAGDRIVQTLDRSHGILSRVASRNETIADARALLVDVKRSIKEQ